MKYQFGGFFPGIYGNRKLHDDRWAAIEVKLGMKQIEEAAANLLKLSQKKKYRKDEPAIFSNGANRGAGCIQAS